MDARPLDYNDLTVDELDSMTVDELDALAVDNPFAGQVQTNHPLVFIFYDPMEWDDPLGLRDLILRNSKG